MNMIDHGAAREFAAAAPSNIALPAAEADCDKLATVLERVETGAASAEEMDYLFDHAHDCSPCFSSIDKQRLFIAFVQGNIRPQGVPTSLVSVIRASIAHEITA